MAAKNKAKYKTPREKSASQAEEAATPYRVEDKKRIAYGNPVHPRAATKTFSVKRAGKTKTYTVPAGGYGYFIAPLQKASTPGQVMQLVEKGFSSKDIESLIHYLDFNVPEIAKSAAVSASTVSRWKPATSIGVAGSGQFFKIDEIVRKGIELFGGEVEFKNWLGSSNMALGNALPLSLITSRLGADSVEEALDALDYGDVM